MAGAFAFAIRSPAELSFWSPLLLSWREAENIRTLPILFYRQSIVVNCVGCELRW